MKSGSTEFCAMMLAKDNYSHNIPKEWLTAKVWDVLCKNPVYKDYVKKHSSYVNEKLHKKSKSTIDKPSEINYINNTNETTTKNSKGDKTMKKNTQIEELTTLVKHLTARIEMLEKGERPKFKKLRERSEQKVETVKKVEPKKSTKNPQVTELQKKAKEMKGKMTKNQLSVYGKLWSKKWQFVNKSIDITKKDERSMAFAKGRIECAKKAMALDI